MKWVFYLVCCKDGSLYCGITNDLKRRLMAHNAGKAAKYTHGRRPVKLVYTEPCVNKSAALKRELQIKKLSRASKQALYHIK